MIDLLLHDPVFVLCLVATVLTAWVLFVMFILALCGAASRGDRR